METEKEKRHVRFDLSINLGHIISLIAFLGSMLMVWINFNFRMAQNEVNIKTLQEQSSDVKTAIGKIQEANSMNSITTMRLTTIIDMMREEQKLKNK
jgi:uncharacterized membrane protein